LPGLDVLLPVFLILILSLSFHEAAHAWTATRLGDTTARLRGRLTLNPLAHIDWIGTVLFPILAIYSGLPIIGWAKPVPVDMRQLKAPRRDFAIVAAAGPASNIVLAILFTLTFKLLGFEIGTTTLAAQLLWLSVSLNVFLAVFNMLPIPPLDGGNVLAGVVGESLARTIDLLRPWGFLILYALLFTGTLGRYVFPIAERITLWLTW
jgi:Zn-dependent protease